MAGRTDGEGDHMSDHPNAQAVRTALEAFSKADIETVKAAIAPDAVWHAPGSNPWSGDFTGADAIFARFAAQMQAGVQITVDIHDVVANDEHAIALVTLNTSGPGGSNMQRAVQVYHLRDGKATEFWGYNEDQAAIDEVMGG